MVEKCKVNVLMYLKRMDTIEMVGDVEKCNMNAAGLTNMINRGAGDQFCGECQKGCFNHGYPVLLRKFGQGQYCKNCSIF